MWIGKSKVEGKEKGDQLLVLELVVRNDFKNVALLRRHGHIKAWNA